MRVSVEENGIIELREVYNPIKIVAENGEEMGVCIRDGVIEIVTKEECARIKQARIVDIKTYNKALTDDQISAKYHGEKNGLNNG